MSPIDRVFDDNRRKNRRRSEAEPEYKSFDIEPKKARESKLSISLIAIRVFAVGAAASGLIMAGMVLAR